MNSQQNHHAIYERFAELSESYHLPVPVDFVLSGEDIFRCPKDLDSVVAGLAERFTEDELSGSGIVVPDDDGNMQLNPMLADADSGFILLRNPYNNEACDLLTIRGCVTNRLPVLAVLADKQTREALDHSESLCVCFTFDDLAYLRSLGLAATAGAGMDKMSPGELESFCKAFEIYTGGFLEDEDVEGSDVGLRGGARFMDPLRSNAAYPNGRVAVSGGQSALDERMQLDGPVECQVVLVEWSPAKMSLDASPSAAPLRSFLEDVRQHLDVDTWDIQNWSPKPKEMERIDFALTRQATPWLRRIISKSLEDSSTSIGRSTDSGRQLRVPPQDYVAALSDLQQNLRGDNALFTSREHEQKLWREFQEKLDHDFINPMRNSAMASLEPQEKMLRLMFAELSRDLLWKLAVSNIKLSNKLAEAGARCGEFTTPEQVKQLAMSMDTVLKLAQEIQRCSETTVITTVVPAMVVKTPPLPALASPTTNSNS